MSDLSVVSNALVIPRPTDVVDVYGLCQSIEQRIAEVDDIATLKDAQAKLGAIAEYVGRTSKDGIAQIQATMRRLEVRVGEVIGVPRAGVNQHTEAAPAGEGSITRHERNEFRQMAEHKEVVEAVIAQSTDKAPPSRAKILSAIAFEKLRKATEDQPDENPRTREGLARRVQTARDMAARGATSSQIAKAIGITAEAMSDFRKRNDLEVPADAIMRNARVTDSNRIVEGTVSHLFGIEAGLGSVEYSTLDGDLLEGWISSLEEAIGSLTTLMKNLKKEQSSRGQS